MFRKLWIKGKNTRNQENCKQLNKEVLDFIGNSIEMLLKLKYYQIFRPVLKKQLLLVGNLCSAQSVIYKKILNCNV